MDSDQSAGVSGRFALGRGIGTLAGIAAVVARGAAAAPTKLAASSPASN